MLGILQSIDLKQMIVTIDMLSDDGLPMEENIVYRIGQRITNTEWVTRIPLGSSVEFSTEKEDQGTLAFIKKEGVGSVAARKTFYPKRTLPQRIPAVQPFQYQPKSDEFWASKDESIRAQMLCKAAIIAISTQNDIAVFNKDKDALIKPTKESITDVAINLNATVNSIINRLKEMRNEAKSIL